MRPEELASFLLLFDFLDKDGCLDTGFPMLGRFTDTLSTSLIIASKAANLFFSPLFVDDMTDFLELVIEIFELLTVAGDSALSFAEESSKTLLFND